MTTSPVQNDAREYDVVIASDLGLPGGTSSCIVDEVKCQAQAGYRTGLFHASIDQRRRLVNPRILGCIEDGLADLIVGPQPVRTRLLVVRHPRVVPLVVETLPPIEADEMRLVINQLPLNPETGESYYDPAEIAELGESRFGTAMKWMPESLAVRSGLESASGTPELSPETWVGFLNMEEWAVERNSFIDRVPVIGRHSRSVFAKWPGTAEDILGAYPDNPGINVRILGGADRAKKILGYIPPNWTVYPFNGLPSARFLASIDFYVYFHLPEGTEAFSRGVLEALASGAVTILSDKYRPVYGDACLYCEPSEVRGLVDRYYSDWDLFKAQSERGQAFVREGFSYDTHRRRVQELIGASNGPARDYPHPRRGAEDHLLLVIGQFAPRGSIDPVLEALKRIQPVTETIILTLKNHLHHLREQDWLVESLVGLPQRNLTQQESDRIITNRIEALVAEFSPSRAVAIGRSVSSLLKTVLKRHPEIQLVSPEMLAKSSA